MLPAAIHMGAASAHTSHVLVGIICGGVGQIGDLFASVIKRWAGAKDYGNIFPGHGGVIDRLDSVLMCAPVVLCYVWLSMLV